MLDQLAQAQQFYLNGDYALAIAKYYQAKKHMPRDSKLNHNLDLALEQVQLKQSPLVAYSYATLTESFILLLLANLVFIFRKKLLAKTALRYLAILIFIFSLLNFAFISYCQNFSPKAVVIHNSKAHSGNNEAYPVLFELYAGQIIKVSRQEASWSEVKVSNNRAWVDNQAIEFI